MLFLYNATGNIVSDYFYEGNISCPDSELIPQVI